MSRNLKIVASVLILAVVLFLVAKFFHLGPFAQFEICPPDECQIYALDKSGKPVGTSFPKEAGRVRSDFLPNLPPGFPEGLPIDAKPVRVLESYAEAVSEEVSSGTLPHIQLIYSYVTKQNASLIIDNFEKYLKNKGYEVTMSDNDALKQIIGTKASGQSEQLISISAVSQSQLESTVTVSVIDSVIIKR